MNPSLLRCVFSHPPNSAPHKRCVRDPTTGTALPYLRAFVSLHLAQLSPETRPHFRTPPAQPAITAVTGVFGIKSGDALVFNSIVDIKQIFAPIKERIYENNIREVITIYDIFDGNSINSTLLGYRDEAGNSVFSNELKFYKYSAAMRVLSDIESRLATVHVYDKTQESISKFRTFVITSVFIAGSIVSYNLYYGFGSMVGSIGKMESEVTVMSDTMIDLNANMRSMDNNVENISSEVSGMNLQFKDMNSSVHAMTGHVNYLTDYTEEMSINTKKMENSIRQLIIPVKNLDISTQRMNGNFNHMNQTGDSFAKPMDWVNRMLPFYN